MNISIYLYAKDEKDAFNIIYNNINELNLQKYLQINKIDIEKYWKIEGMFDAIVKVTLKNKYIDNEKFEQFLYSICTNFTCKSFKIAKNKFCVEEIIISKNISTFKKINDNIELIVVYIDYDIDEDEDNKELILIEKTR